MKNEYSQAYKDLSYVHEQLGQYEDAVVARNLRAKWFPNEAYLHDDNDIEEIALSGSVLN